MPAFCEGVIREHPILDVVLQTLGYRTTAEQGRFPSYSRYFADIAP